MVQRGEILHKAREPRQRKKGFGLSRLPKPVENAWLRTREIAKEHNVLTVLYFLLPSLLGTEATESLLYWSDGWFVVCRSKTGFCYHLRLSLLHEMLKSLGLREGLLNSYFSVWEQMNAQEAAHEYNRRFYQSHPNARRLHYFLKEEQYI